MSSDRRKALLREIADKRAELDSMSDLSGFLDGGKIKDDSDKVRRGVARQNQGAEVGIGRAESRCLEDLKARNVAPT